MSLKKNIRKILNEENLTPNAQNKFALGVLKFSYRRIYNYINSLENRDVKDWPGETLDDFISRLSNDIKKNADDVLQILFNGVGEVENPLLKGFYTEETIKWLYEFIVNYKNGGKKIEVADVILEKEFWSYVNDNIFLCDDNFFEFVWDNYFVKTNQWSEGLKDRMWEDILPEVEEKMEDEEWQEENGVTFDGLDREKSYFYSYWHYPIDSLGWNRGDLCEYYKDILEMGGGDKLYGILKFYKTPKIQKVFVDGQFYIIIHKGLFL